VNRIESQAEEEQNREPWNLVRSSLDRQENPNEIFRGFQDSGRRLFGFIVGVWDAQGNLVCYLHEAGIWQSFEASETAIEAPKILKTLKGADNNIARGNEEDSRAKWEFGSDVHVGLTVWVHSEAGYAPMERYLLSKNIQFPGSPSR